MNLLHAILDHLTATPPRDHERHKSDAEQRLERELEAIQGPKERVKMAIEQAAPRMDPARALRRARALRDAP